MANPCGTRTFWLDNFWIISPNEAFLPPTSGTSSMPNSSKKRTYPDVLMICPLVARQALRYGDHRHTQRHNCQPPTAAAREPGSKVTRIGDSPAGVCRVLIAMSYRPECRSNRA